MSVMTAWIIASVVSLAILLGLVGLYNLRDRVMTRRFEQARRSAAYHRAGQVDVLPGSPVYRNQHREEI